MNKTRFVLWLIVGIILLSSCYSSRNTAKIGTDFRGAYIAPKGFNISSNNPNQLISTGAFYADGTIRIGIHNAYRDGDGQLKIKYLAEEQPDMGLELLKAIKASADLDNGQKGGNAHASAKFLDSVKTSLMDITHKSSTLNLARSILYRFNEDVYNGSDLALINKYIDDIIPKFTELQKQEFIKASNESSDNLKVKRIEFLLNIDKVTQSLKDNKLSEKEIQDIIKGVTVND